MNRETLIYASTLRKQLFRQQLLRSLVMTADGESSDELKVLNTGDGAKLLMEIFTDYVSEYDFRNFMTFMRDADMLLYRARGNKPFTHEERRAMEQDNPAPVRKKKRKKNNTPPPASIDTVPAVTAMARTLTSCMAIAA